MNLPKPIKFRVERYIGGLSQFKKTTNPIKLSANESALGPSPRAISAYINDKDKIIKYVYNEKKKDPKGNIHSNRGGWQSHREYHADENILSTIIRTELINYFVKKLRKVF